jgi:hypothetical protein
VLGPASGKFPTLAVDPQGLVVTYHDESGMVVLVQLFPDGTLRTPDVPLALVGKDDVFPTVYVDLRKQTWVAWRGPGNIGLLLNVTTGAVTELGEVHGTVPFAFISDSIFWLSTPQFAVTQALLSNPGNRQVVRNAAGTGITAFEGRLATIDELRASVPGMANPQRAASCTVGEADTPGLGPHNLARLTDGREAILWPGKVSFTPRIAARDGRYYIVTWGAPHGVRLAIREDADFTAPVAVPEPPVVTPPIPQEPEKPTVQIPDHFVHVKAVSDAYPHLLAENSRASMTELLWRVAYKLSTIDANWGLLSKSEGENHTVIVGKRVAVDALAYSDSHQIVDIFGSAYDGPGQGRLTWGIDERRPSNVFTPVPPFPGAPVPPVEEPKPPVVPPVAPPAPTIDLGPLQRAFEALAERVLGTEQLVTQLLTKVDALARRQEDLAIQQGNVVVQQTDQLRAELKSGAGCKVVRYLRG